MSVSVCARVCIAILRHAHQCLLPGKAIGTVHHVVNTTATCGMPGEW